MGKRIERTKEYCAKLSRSKCGHSVSPETRLKISNSKKGCVPWNKGLKKESDERIADLAKKVSSAKTGKKYPHQSVLMKKLWKDKSYYDRQCLSRKLAVRKPKTREHERNILRAVCSRPNKFEARALAYLEYLYPKKFKYVGDGSLLVDHRSADAFSKELNTIALFHGDYWHCNPKKYSSQFYHSGRRMTAKQIWEYDENSKKVFEGCGYKVITIWESDLNAFARQYSRNIMKRDVSTSF